jgi:hypothetical protein
LAPSPENLASNVGWLTILALKLWAKHGFVAA